MDRNPQVHQFAKKQGIETMRFGLMAAAVAMVVAAPAWAEASPPITQGTVSFNFNDATTTVGTYTNVTDNTWAVIYNLVAPNDAANPFASYAATGRLVFVTLFSNGTRLSSISFDAASATGNSERIVVSNIGEDYAGPIYGDKAVFYTDPAGQIVRYSTSMFFDRFTIETGAIIDNVTVTYTSVVPEASTWAMMIAGFGLVGGTMRRRAQRSHAAVSQA
jgi:hypothetical protein